VARKFHALHKFHKERRRSPSCCFKCGDNSHFIADCPKRKKFDSPTCTTTPTRTTPATRATIRRRTDSETTTRRRRSSRRSCPESAPLSDFNISSEDSSILEEDEKIKCKKGDFTRLCLIGKSSPNDSNSDSVVSDDLSFKSLSSKVVELENALCNQDKLLCKFFCVNKKLNLELENTFAEIASLQLMHDDMSAQPCENCNMIMANYVDLWIVHIQVVSQLKGAKLELKELKARSLLLGAYLECPKLKLELDARSLKVKELETKLLEKPRVSLTSPPCEVCGTLKGKLFYATKENNELKQEVAYLTSRLERTTVSEKMIEDDLNCVEESVTKSTNKLGVGFERCEDKGEKSAPMFVPRSNYHKEEETLKSTKTHYPSNPKPSFNPKREVRKEPPKPREGAIICMFCGRASHLDEF
jgi:hypothetical protein